jgi:pimeloyl-ACP methyl ester carboxylesterase
MKDDTGVILIHGAGLNSSVWDKLLPLLVLPSLPVILPNRYVPAANKNLSFDHYMRDTIWQIEAWNKKRIVMAAHSIGGCIALEAAEYFREKLAGFVAISAAIPRPGRSFISCLPFPKRLLMPTMLKLAGARPRDKQIAATLCNGLTKEETQKVIEKFTPESPNLYAEKLHYSPINAPSLYIKLSEDKALSLPRQRKMAKNLRAEGTAMVEGGHLAMMSRPRELAAIMNQFISDQL